MDKCDPGNKDVLDFVSSIAGPARMRIEENLPHGFVRLKVAEAERRQAQHDIRSVEDIVTELVRNSRDAGSRNVLVAFQKEQGRYRRITVLDDGKGIPSDMHNLVFEPRVTSKREDFEEDRYGVHGRGMALFSIRSRAESAGIVNSVPGLGTIITLTVDTERVPERSDQATLPRLEPGEKGHEVGPGPHNVLRVLLEMSIDCPGMSFYMGSFAEVLATAISLGCATAADGGGAVWSEVSRIADAKTLAEASAGELGLPVSERNAYRILGGEIAPLKPVYVMAGLLPEQETRTGEAAAHPGLERGTLRKSQPARNPLKRLGKADMDEIALGAGQVVERVVGRYFLRPAVEPKVRRGRGKITLSFYITGEDGDED